jgi:glycosyltransferase involved in cell wall biosynthesis
MRVLLLANDCNPQWPSLPVVGYNACRGIAEHVDVVVATHIRNKPNIDEKGFGKAQVVYLDNEYIASPMYKAATWLRGGRSVGWTTNIAMQYPPYLAFEWEAWKTFAKQLKAGEFDLVHRVTPMSPTLPSPMAKWLKKIGVPFVLGPLNGGLPWPPEFTGELKKEKEWLTYVRNGYKLLPYASSTYAKSSAILAAFQHTIDKLPAKFRDRMIDFPEVGIDPELFEAPPQRPVREQVTFFYAGRLVPYKCPDVAVLAMAANPNLRKHKLIVAGDGPEMPRLVEIVKQQNLEGCVELIGRRTQAEVGQLMRSADILAFPSIRELGAGVVVEAMACAMACIVVNYGGPGGLIHDESGVRVPLGNKQHLIDHFAVEMESLANDPERRQKFGRRAHQDAMEIYSWGNKGKKTVEVYEWVLTKQSTPPDFYVSS